LEAQALDLAIDKIVHFVGRKSNDELPFWYSAADIFVLPSLREGTPLALLEALSCEVPVIVSRAGGMVEVIEDGKNGLLTDIADPVDLEKKLSLLLADSDMRQRFKETARDTVLSWADIQVEIDTILHLYRNFGAAATPTNRF
jgi:glycosyltransferase involved in cell wall biosynthesis